MIDFAIIEITEKCNLNCSHCYLKNKSKKTMIKKNIDTILKQLQLNNCKKITISGGEPFATPDLLEYTVKLAKKNGFYITVVSNGTLFKNIDSTLFEYIDHIQISLDGLESTHDIIRGAGSFRSTLNGIEYLISKELKEKLSVQMTISAINQQEFFKAYDLVNNLGVKMSVERVSLVGNATDYELLDFNNYSKILDFIIDNKLLSSDPWVNVRKLHRLKIDPSSIIFEGGCSAGKTGLSITVDGDVLPCVRIRNACGNIFETDLEEIIMGCSYCSYAKPIGKCENCKFSKICGGCKADLLSDDVMCFIND